MGAGAERNEKDAGWYSVALPLLSLGGLQNDADFSYFLYLDSVNLFHLNN